MFANKTSLYRDGLGLAAEQMTDMGTEVLDDDLDLAFDVVRMQAPQRTSAWRQISTSDTHFRW